MTDRTTPKPPDRKPPERIEKREGDRGFPPPPERTPSKPTDQTPKKSS